MPRNHQRTRPGHRLFGRLLIWEKISSIFQVPMDTVGGQDVFPCLLHHSADAFTSYGIVAFLVKQTAQSTGMGRKSDRSFAEPFWKEKTKQKRPSISPSADRAAFLLLRLCLCARKMTSYITGKGSRRHAEYRWYWIRAKERRQTLCL